jgi:hypothetical protein
LGCAAVLREPSAPRPDPKRRPLSPPPPQAQSEREKLLRLGDELHKRVVGQDEAVSKVRGVLGLSVYVGCVGGLG